MTRTANSIVLPNPLVNNSNTTPVVPTPTTTNDGFKIGARVVGKIKKHLNAKGVIIAIADGGRVEVRWDNGTEISTVTTRAIALEPAEETAAAEKEETQILLKSTILPGSTYLSLTSAHPVDSEVKISSEEAEYKTTKGRGNKRTAAKQLTSAALMEGDSSSSEDELGENINALKANQETTLFAGEEIDPTVSVCTFVSDIVMFDSYFLCIL